MKQALLAIIREYFKTIEEKEADIFMDQVADIFNDIFVYSEEKEQKESKLSSFGIKDPLEEVDKNGVISKDKRKIR